MLNLKVEMQAGLLAGVQVWKYSGRSGYNNQIFVLPRAEDISGLSENHYLVRNDKSVSHN